ncbi:hypothetical protein PTSG_02839 [Salpingoeca rosetta]|uniref:Uncharacterized protein n=1 Tax=Salpingoeca rosetta (strain ATCC 50818 / BSB-021) TaxID=946362 RepID=F2U3H2_SALR5|nr:uncharacterized protein PTSG_02839 [Salpingoeca rosetta]EGD82166.1 hypothetical protein PTSG_02839 [Salpingoeca rosetta]|eukprot:XP_004996349.1 hypothetical protein PTSG_02839 [Salpingoeca rosetta]
MRLTAGSEDAADGGGDGGDGDDPPRDSGDGPPRDGGDDLPRDNGDQSQRPLPPQNDAPGDGAVAENNGYGAYGIRGSPQDNNNPEQQSQQQPEHSWQCQLSQPWLQSVAAGAFLKDLQARLVTVGQIAHSFLIESARC